MAKRKHPENRCPVKRKASRDAHRAKCRQRIYDFFGGECEHCGSKESLQVDHIDPEEKEFSIGSYIGYKWEKIYPELLKCQLLCIYCHIKKGQENGDYNGRA
jgi:5-methylcytosine-specific restriction endonuclease McrA